MYIPEQIAEILTRLENAGHEAYVVGGCVRDDIMGLAAHDFDITTSALPDRVEEIFSDCRVIETGLRHGTVTILYKGSMAEITTFRTDGEYTDGRHPDNVFFTASLEDDLSRRDFTINGIAYSPARGFVDPFGGTDDIHNGVIRCIGSPEQRFGEDALRILRALRFSSVLGFEIEENTAAAARALRHTLRKVSKERIFAELMRLLCGKDVRRVIMEYPDVLSVFLPPIAIMKDYDQHTKYHIYTLLEHTARAVEHAPAEPALRLAMLFHDMGKPSAKTEDENGAWHFGGHAEHSMRIADELMRELKASNELRLRVLGIVQLHDVPLELSEKHIRRMLSRYGFDLFRDIMYAHIADDNAKADFCRDRIEIARQSIEIAERIMAARPCLTLKDLAISGDDLKTIMQPSPMMGKILKQLLQEVLDEKLRNKKPELMARAAELVGV